MDAGFLNVHGEEHFSTLESSYFFDLSGDDTGSYDDTSNHGYVWDWESERELNGDVGLIPVSGRSGDDFRFLSESPPSKEDFHKIMSEWQQLVSLETDNVEDLAVDIPISNTLEHTAETQDNIDRNNLDNLSNVMEPSVNVDNCENENDANVTNDLSLIEISTSSLEDPIKHLIDTSFDITTYVNESERPISSVPGRPSGPGPGGKKIDMKNHRYVIYSDSEDEDVHVDVETISEPNTSFHDDEQNTEENVNEDEAQNDLLHNISTDINIDDLFVTSTPAIDDLLKTELHSDNLQETCLEDVIYNIEPNTLSLEQNNDAGSSPPPEIKSEVINSIDILDEVYPKQTQPVIEAGDLNSLLEKFEATETSKDCESVANKQQHEILLTKSAKNKQILQALPRQLIKCIKHSGKRKTITVTPIPIKKRSKELPPSYKIVQLDHDYCLSDKSSKKDSGFSSCEEDERSVLRNQPTIKTADGKLMVSLLKVNTIKKRKLNLEEYKQLRQGRSRNDNPSSTGDENARRLQKMNIQPQAPPNMEVKTLVSIGVNTDQSWGRLQEIVRGLRVNFSPNSLITSLVQQLPHVKEELQTMHGEDKTIVYLDKNRAVKTTNNKYTQTILHRRSSSSSSSSSSRSSRSPSPSCRTRWNSTEVIREVEERRVVYVGRIEDYIRRSDLRHRFSRFGPINKVSVHFRKNADNYGFVTFKHKEDAYEAVEHGNDDPTQSHYDLSFGGRRMFCQSSYADLDNMHDDAYLMPQLSQENSFDVLLREAQEKLFHYKRMH